MSAKRICAIANLLNPFSPRNSNRQAHHKIFKDKKAFDRFKSDRLEFDAQVSAIAVTLGAAAKAAYEKGIAVFIMTKGGLMYEASVGGQSFTFTPD